MGELVAGELYVESWGPPDAPALLYLHGGPGQGSYEFVQYQAALLSARLRGIALDQRGVLRSAALPPDRGLTLADMVADCETVRAHLGLESWALLGQSFGGMLALRYATEHPSAVTAVAFENPCWDVDRTCRSLLAALVAHRTAGAHPQAVAAATAMLATDAQGQPARAGDSGRQSDFPLRCRQNLHRACTRTIALKASFGESIRC